MWLLRWVSVRRRKSVGWSREVLMRKVVWVGRCELTAVRAKVAAVIRMVESFIFPSREGEDEV